MTCSLQGGIRLACLLPYADIEVALIGRNILNDTSPTGGIDFNNLTGYVNEPQVLERGDGSAFLNEKRFDIPCRICYHNTNMYLTKSV